MFIQGIKQNPVESCVIPLNHFGARFGAHIFDLDGKIPIWLTGFNPVTEDLVRITYYTYVHWEQENDSPPALKSAFHQLVSEGVVSRVRHPSNNHATRAFSAPIRP